MIHLHARFHISSSNGSLFTVATLKVKRNFHIAAMLFLHSNKCLKKLHIFLRSITIQICMTVLSGASVGPTSLVRAPAMLLLLIVRY
jgi:hypothetical protein